MADFTAQSKPHDKELVPRFLVIAMFALIACSLVLVGFARLTDRPLVGVPQDTSIASEVRLNLVGTRDGSVTVLDESGRVVASSEDEKMGFIGVIWRVMARERMLNDVPDTAPVRLVRRENGHVAILDTVTDWSVELIGYGPDNIAAFARLVD